MSHYERTRTGDIRSHGSGGGGGGNAGDPRFDRPNYPPPSHGSTRDSSSSHHYHPPPRHRLEGGPRERHDPYRKRGGKGSSTSTSVGPIGDIRFRSYAEERHWVEERRRKRNERTSLFDKLPTEEQIALEELQKAALASHGPNPNVFLKPEDRVSRMDASSSFLPSISSSSSSSTVVPSSLSTLSSSVLLPSHQTTRHARRLYVGNLPDGLTEGKILHDFFRDCVFRAMSLQDDGNEKEDDPITNIYINEERHYAFVEFKSMDVTTACLALNGIHMYDLGPLIIKRPNDYNPRIAPPVNVDFLKRFNVSNLGLVSPFVPDSPDKIYVSGLPFHLLDDQVKELLSAFGKLKAFHLVKADISSSVNLGYCFVEFVEPNVRDIAIMGLNGMEMGGGKTLSAKLASDRLDGEGAEIGTAAMGSNVMNAIAASSSMVPLSLATSSTGVSIPPPIMKYVDGVDVEALVDLAVGGRENKVFASSISAKNPLVDVADAELAAIYGPGGNTSTAATNGLDHNPIKTRILVLHNMVSDEDFSTEQDYQGLKEEVEEECQKYGNLISLKIPRPSDHHYPSSALKKIYLEYGVIADAVNAEHELSGRKFGDSIVATSFFSESEYKADKLN